MKSRGKIRSFCDADMPDIEDTDEDPLADEDEDTDEDDGREQADFELHQRERAAKDAAAADSQATTRSGVSRLKQVFRAPSGRRLRGFSRKAVVELLDAIPGSRAHACNSTPGCTFDKVDDGLCSGWALFDPRSSLFVVEERAFAWVRAYTAETAAAIGPHFVGSGNGWQVAPRRYGMPHTKNYFAAFAISARYNLDGPLSREQRRYDHLRMSPVHLCRVLRSVTSKATVAIPPEGCIGGSIEQAWFHWLKSEHVRQRWCT